MLGNSQTERASTDRNDKGQDSGRKLGRLFGVVALAGAIFAAGAAAVTVSPSGAASGGNLVLGRANSASNPTSLSGHGFSPVLAVNNNSYAGVGLSVSANQAPGLTVRSNTNDWWHPGLVTTNSHSGPALRVNGIASFSRSGVVIISAFSRQANAEVPGGLVERSRALAMLQTDAGAGIVVSSAVPNRGSGTITITLSQAPTFNVAVAWFVFG